MIKNLQNSEEHLFGRAPVSQQRNMLEDAGWYLPTRASPLGSNKTFLWQLYKNSVKGLTRNDIERIAVPFNYDIGLKPEAVFVELCKSIETNIYGAFRTFGISFDRLPDVTYLLYLLYQFDRNNFLIEFYRTFTTFDVRQIKQNTDNNVLQKNIMNLFDSKTINVHIVKLQVPLDDKLVIDAMNKKGKLIKFLEYSLPKHILALKTLKESFDKHALKDKSVENYLTRVSPTLFVENQTYVDIYIKRENKIIAQKIKTDQVKILERNKQYSGFNIVTPNVGMEME